MTKGFEKDQNLKINYRTKKIVLQISRLFGNKVEFTQAAGGLQSFCSLHHEIKRTSSMRAQ